MSERQFRIVQGIFLLVALLLESDIALYSFVALALFEGTTNWRIPKLVSRIRRVPEAVPAMRGTWTQFEAERMLRLMVAVILFVSLHFFPAQTWFLPWFVGAMLMLAGVTNTCPMIIFFRVLGFR